MTGAAEETGILAGVTVVEVSGGMAGAIATWFLAEAGADVISVAPPEGDPMRRFPALATWNRSKRGMEVDLGSEEGRQALRAVLARADVLVHGFTPAQASELALSDDALRAECPTLIVSSVTGFARTHEDVERRSDEILVQARSGVMDEQPPLDHRPGPVFYRLPVLSWMAAYLLAIGILARLVDRRRTGRVGPVHTSLLQGALAALSVLWTRAERPTEFLSSKIPVPRDGPIGHLWTMECADGEWIQVTGYPNEAPLVVETFASMGEKVPDPSFETRFAACAAWRRMFRLRPAREWLHALWEADVPAQRVLRLGEILLDEEAKLNGYVVDVADPVWGTSRQAAVPVHVEPPVRVRAPAPVLDEGAASGIAPTVQRPVAADNRPLAGLTVVDAGMYFAGPFGAMVLGDLGATVVKLEPTDGDRMRQYDVLFAGCQRGKRSLAIDLSRAESREILDAVLRTADVLHHNLRIDKASDLGLANDRVRTVNPELVICHVSAFGERGARRMAPGYDPQAQAMSGWMHEGSGAGRPMWLRLTHMDTFAGLGSAVATLLGLYRRYGTGEGSVVGSSLLGAATVLASETMVPHATGSPVAVPQVDDDVTGLGPGYRIYELADGWIAVAALTSEAMDGLRAVAGAGRTREVAGSLRRRACDEVLAGLAARGVPAERVRVDHEAAFFSDPANRAAGLVASYPHAVYGTLEQVGSFWHFGDVPAALTLAPPLLGEHSVEILDALGIPADRARHLIETGVVVDARGIDAVAATRPAEPSTGDRLRAGTRLGCPGCPTQLVVVSAPGVPATITCHGEPLTTALAGERPMVRRTEELALLGKRYVDAATTLEVLVTRAGRGPLAVDGRMLTVKQAKKLPTSD